jgi:hypothetical protein
VNNPARTQTLGPEPAFVPTAALPVAIGRRRVTAVVT